MNIKIRDNFNNLKPSILFIPLILLVLLVLMLYQNNALSVESYINFQKDWFLYLNAKLSHFPNLEINLTHLGDTLIVFSILGIFILYAPKIWEALLSASIISLVFSNVLKKIFSVPRPAKFLDQDTFVIIGKTLKGHNSLPSGHSITIFSVLTILMFAFMPKKTLNKVLWIISILAIGLFLILTRVGVGAHYPLDTIFGGIVGFVAGVLGIFVNRKYAIWHWIYLKKYYPLFIIFFAIGSFLIFTRILNENLLIYYISFVCFTFSLYKTLEVYVKK